MSRRSIIIGVVAAAVIAGPGFFWGVPAWRAHAEHSLRDRLAHDPKTAESYQLLQKGEERMAREPDNPEGFLSAGLAWKSIGEATGERRFLERSLDIYERGVLLFGDRNAVVTLNAANLNRDLGRYERAEHLYREAIRLNPGGSDAYLALVDLYRYRMNKDSRAIIDVYNEALSAVLENAELVQHLAFYLKDLGRYAEAISYFELLEKDYPGQFAPVIEELRRKIGSS